MQAWQLFEPPLEELYEINTFDDGNQAYAHYANAWLIFGTWRGKCAVVNRSQPELKIKSISCWKLSKLHIL